MSKEHLVDPQLQDYKKSDGRGKICRAIPLMSKQAGAAQNWAHTHHVRLKMLAHTTSRASFLGGNFKKKKRQTA
jgi:hypothetical protein